MKRKTLILSFYSLLFFLTLGMASCEKPIIDVLDEDTGNVVPAEANVILHFTQYEWTEQREPFELARRWPSRDGQRRSQQESFTRGGTGYRAFKPSDATFSTSSSNVKGSTVLRPVVTITINKE